jgi:hypothetical protein
MADTANPLLNITVAGKKYKLQFDVNTNPTKKGVKLQFVLDEAPEDPRDKQKLASEISVALQKRLGESNVMVDYDERNPYKNVIGFIVPLNSVAKMIVQAMKGGGG